MEKKGFKPQNLPSSTTSTLQDTPDLFCSLVTFNQVFLDSSHYHHITLIDYYILHIYICHIPNPHASYFWEHFTTTNTCPLKGYRMRATLY